MEDKVYIIRDALKRLGIKTEVYASGAVGDVDMFDVSIAGNDVTLKFSDPAQTSDVIIHLSKKLFTEEEWQKLVS